MVQLKVRKVGNSLGVILTGDVAGTLQVAEGDTLYLTASPAGFLLTPFNPEFAEEMELAADIMKRYRNALRDLAK